MSVGLIATLVVGAAIAATIVVVWIVRRVYIAEGLRQGTEDVEGFYITVLGAMYAVIVAFMIFVVWTAFDEAAGAVTHEATVLGDVYRLAEALPQAAQDPIQNACREYANAIVHDEWPAMADGKGSPRVGAVTDTLWEYMYAVQVQALGTDDVRELLLNRVAELSEHRNARLLRARSRLPGVLWGLLYFGCVLTVGFAAVFGVRHFFSHALKAGVIAALISAALFVIAALDHPFCGRVQVLPDSFEDVLEVFELTESRSAPAWQVTTQP